MNVKKIFGMLLICVTTALVSCNKEAPVEISKLDGMWDVFYEDPNLQVDGSVTYWFDVFQVCHILISNPLEDQKSQINCTYTLGAGDHLITLYETGKEEYFQQYWIKELESGEMRWENASPGDGNPAEIKFKKGNPSIALD